MTDNIKKENDSKKIFTLLIMIFTLMVCTTGATYAYFAISATATNNITGTAATASLSFDWGPTLVYPAAGNTVIDGKTYTFSTSPLVPQKSLNGDKNVLQLAVTGGNPSKDGTTKVPCVDDNGNAICRVYGFTLENESTATVGVTGSISFAFPNGSNFNNLKWHLMDTKDLTNPVSSTTIKAATTTAQIFGTKNSFTPGSSLTYYIVVWIEEMDYDQGITQTEESKRDIGTFYATINFSSTNGTGLTSTITG